MSKHYTYDEIKKAVFSSSEIPGEMLEHFGMCEECMEVFLSVSEKLSVRPIKNSSVNIAEQVAIKRHQLRELMYNARVVFGVFAAILMLFNIPLPSDEKVDIIRQNYEEVSYVSQKKEEFREDFEEGFDKFMEFYTKGITNDDKTKK